MITLYRVFSLALLFGSGASFFSLLAQVKSELRSPILLLALLTAGVVGGFAWHFYSAKDDPDQTLNLMLCVGIVAVLLTGGLIQWM